MDSNNEYGLREIHKQLLEVLVEFDRFCRENGVCYSLTYGSLIGAVREHGIISWDDDVDIMLDRDNYEKLMGIIDRFDGYSSRMELWITRVRKKDITPIDGYDPAIDLLVIDAVPENRLCRVFKKTSVKILQGMLKKRILYSEHSLTERVFMWGTHVLGKLFTEKSKQKLYHRICKIGNNKPYSRVCCYNGLFKALKKTFDKSIMEAYTDYDFDGYKFMGIKNYDVFLRSLYKLNYMTPPPMEQRIPRHM